MQQLLSCDEYIFPERVNSFLRAGWTVVPGSVYYYGKHSPTVHAPDYSPKMCIVIEKEIDHAVVVGCPACHSGGLPDGGVPGGVHVKLTELENALVAEYGHLMTNIGGGDIVELLEREGITFSSDKVVAELQVSCLSQVKLLQRLQQEGLLASVYLLKVGPEDPRTSGGG